MSLIEELKRRKVFKVGAAYLVVGWLLIQVAATVAPQLNLPEWAPRFVTFLIMIGFPIALVLAWVFDMTPDGVRREAPASGTKLMVAIAGVLAAAVLAWYLLPQLGRKGDTAPATAAPANSSGKSIAVLPFADLSPGHDQEYFSDGMAEELLNALAKLKDLKVAARTASFHYKGRNESLKVIGTELGVDHIVEGSVRKQGERVRITAQLIRAGDGFHLWSETYDGELSDVFELQERIARAITGQLQIVLQGGARLVPVATTSQEAYALFLQATAVYNRRDDNLRPAIDALEQALRLDPKFARAQARLAAVHVVTVGRPGYETALAEAERNARAAIALDDAIAEPWAALGRSYYEQRRFMDAREALDEALKREPDDALANYWHGVYLIMMGYTKDGRARIDRALELDPMQPNAQLWQGLELSYAGEHEAAERVMQRAADMGLSFAAYGIAEAARGRGDAARAYEVMSRRYSARLTRCGLTEDEGQRALKAGWGVDVSQRDAVVADLERCLAKPGMLLTFGALKLLWQLGEADHVLRWASAGTTDNETFLFQLLWSPLGATARRSPGFPEFARKTGLVAVWDKYGPPDTCRRAGEGEYACE